MNCPCCVPENINNLDNTFGDGLAQKDARRYRKKGLDRRGRKLIAAFQQAPARPLSILEVGCGAGAVHHELLREGIADRAHGVDAAGAYLRAAQENADYFGLDGRVTYQQSDFAQTTADFEEADLVIMDRVICCYPHLQKLLGRASRHAGRYLALSFPAEDWWVLWAFKLFDWFLHLFNSGYHPYVHPHRDILAIAAEHGLTPVHRDRSGIWQILVFART